MVYDRPGFVFKEEKFGDREISPEDDQRLIDSIYWCDLVISGPTSICLDSILLNKPVIAVNFYPSQRNFYEQITAYHRDHIKKLLATGGVKYITEKKYFLPAIDEYFKNPKLDSQGRAKARAMWFSHADGQASQRLAREIISFLKL